MRIDERRQLGRSFSECSDSIRSSCLVLMKIREQVAWGYISKVNWWIIMPAESVSIRNNDSKSAWQTELYSGLLGVWPLGYVPCKPVRSSKGRLGRTITKIDSWLPMYAPYAKCTNHSSAA